MTVTDRWWGSVGVGNPDAAPAHIGVHIDTLRDSIAGYTTALFANVTDRATATADFLAAHPDAVGMKGFVAGRGACVYDANVRPGSGGWTWESQEVDLVQLAGLAGFSSSATEQDFVTGATYVINHGTYNRRIRVSVGGYIQNATGSPVSGACNCQIRVRRNSAELAQIRIASTVLPASVILPSASENRSYASWVYTFSGTSTFQLRMLREAAAGITGSVDAHEVTFLVTDLGPAD